MNLPPYPTTDAECIGYAATLSHLPPHPPAARQPHVAVHDSELEAYLGDGCTLIEKETNHDT